MANNYLDWLRKAGVTGPALQELTEAQIGEKNKSNPLSGYGFQSAQEKQQRAMQQSMLEQQIQMAQEQQQQALLQSMNSQSRIGHYAGQGARGLVDMFRNRNQPQASPEAPPQNDPQIDRYNQLAAEVGPAQAKIMLGQELVQSGNAGGSALMEAGQKELEAQRDKALERKVKEAGLKKPNPTVTKPGTDTSGRPTATLSEVTLGDDGSNHYKDVSTGLKGSTTGAPGDWLTRPQGGKIGSEFEGSMTATENVLDANDRILNIVEGNPTAQGMAAELTSKANNLVYGFKNLREIVSPNLDNTAKAKLAASDPTKQYASVFDSMRGVAKDNAKLKALLLEQAYLKATAGGQKATDKDVAYALKELGDNLSDPEAFKEVIQQNRELTIDRLMNEARNTGPNGQSLSETFASRLKGIGARRNPNKPQDKGGLSEEEKAELEALRKQLIK